MSISEVSCDLSAYDDDIAIESPYLKTLCCAPVLGLIPYVIAELSLTKQIKAEKDLKKAIQLIELKNEYKICFVLSNILATAMAISTLASPIILAVPLTFAALTIKGIIQNYQVIDKYTNPIKKSNIASLIN